MNMRTCLFIFALLVGAASLVDRADAQVSRLADDPLRHGHALLIGNSHYRDSRWPRLDDIPLQLDALRKGLEPHFDTVQVEKDLETDQLRAKLTGFLRSYGNDSDARLFIYYAGHGYTEVIRQRNENRGYITGIDTPHYVGTAQGYTAARLKAISMAEIRAPLEEVLAHSILFLFDSCFAGTIFTDRSGNDFQRPLTPEVVSDLMKKQSRDIITAGMSDQRVPAHSPIPDLFLAALNGAADPYKQGVISSVDIYTYMLNRVANIRDINLTPQHGSLPNPAFAEGKFLFRVTNPAIPTRPAADPKAPVTVPPQVAVVAPPTVITPLNSAAVAKSLLQAADRAIGASSVASWTAAASAGWMGYPGQQFAPGDDLPRSDLKSFTYTVEYPSKSAKWDYVRVQGNNPPLGGGAGFPVAGEQKFIEVVNDNFAWNLNALGQPARQFPREAANRQLRVWLTPHGFIRAALASNNAALSDLRLAKQNRTVKVVGFTIKVCDDPQPYCTRLVTGEFNNDNLLERTISWYADPVMGDDMIEYRWSNYRDLGGGVKLPFHLHAQLSDTRLIPGNVLDVQFSDVRVNIPNAAQPVPDTVRNAPPPDDRAGGRDDPCTRRRPHGRRLA
jgi:hypothetical protein